MKVALDDEASLCHVFRYVEELDSQTMLSVLKYTIHLGRHFVFTVLKRYTLVCACAIL